MSLDLLVLGPHPDDAELCCGGLLALAARRGQRAGIVDLTRGEAATHGTVEVRAREAAAAAEALDLVHRSNLGLPDAGLRGDDPDQLDALVEALRRLTPSLLVAPWTEARHPDHAAAGRLAHTAVFLAGLRNHRPELGPPHRPRLVHYPMRIEVRPDFVVDTSDVVEVKRRAVACHASQLGHGDTLVGSTVGADAFEARDRYWGASIGVRHGEPYVLGSPVPVADPVQHFAGLPVPALVPPR